ncbi:MAG TPA: glycogen debranching protein GlgX [Bryobacteraceae bacterium]|nr:glycogen debranching protein GlgX [Bryobacteraceae bacterium]
MPVPPFPVERGRPHPLGADVTPEGVNFSLFSAHATGVELLLFETCDAPQPYQTIRLDPYANKSFHFWHVFVRGLRPPAHYAYRLDGPWDPSAGHRFNRRKVLIDPYARGNTDALWSRAAACTAEDNLATSMRSVAVDSSGYDWEGDAPLRRPMNETIIYEMHVRGFTASPTSGVRHPGTFAGIVEKIPYFEELGITAVELMPVFDFDIKEPLRVVEGVPLHNYWGYSSLSFFAPQSAYCVWPEEGRHATEFRDMVKALHRAGIELILDVVFNHSDEGNHLGPTFSFRGLDNRTYYLLVPWDKQYYLDFTGCGNTLNCNHPIVQKLIVESLRYWVREMHVDGFRFDLASVFVRGQDGAPLPTPPLVWQIELDEALAEAKVIAEAWDAAGLYQVGHFPGDRWAEWNGRFRDDVRRFVRGDPGLLGAIASRIGGSADIYERQGELPINSINFVTCHDGFTLNDLVSYNQKHNEANGEDNRDGSNENLSWNCGVEGPSEAPEVEALRARQIRNFAAILLLSRGVPMLLMGDEVRRTQHGNNNAYCQDGPLSWFDWDLLERHADILRFFRLMIAFRKRHSTFQRGRFFTGQLDERGIADVAWHGTKLGKPGFADPYGRALAFTLGGSQSEPDLHVMMNMYWEPLEFEVPQIPGRRWHKAIDTAAAPPEDIFEAGEEPAFDSSRCMVTPRSITVLLAR